MSKYNIRIKQYNNVMNIRICEFHNIRIEYNIYKYNIYKDIKLSKYKNIGISDNLSIRIYIIIY